MTRIEKRSEKLHPSSNLWTIMRWVLLVNATAVLLTNAYYQHFLEPAMSRELLARVAIALAAAALLAVLLYERYSPEHHPNHNWQKLFAICPLVAELEAVAGRHIRPTVRILHTPIDQRPWEAAHRAEALMGRSSKVFLSDHDE